MVRRSKLERPFAEPPAGPVDVNQAPAELLRRVPGLGRQTVERLLAIRQSQRIRLRDLQRLNVPLSRAKPHVITADYRPTPPQVGKPSTAARVEDIRQLSLFEHCN